MTDSSVTKDIILRTVKKMRVNLAWDTANISEALELFDSIHENPDITFHAMKIPNERNERRKLKIELNLLCRKAKELCLKGKLNMQWWIHSTDKLLTQSIANEAERKQRRRTLANRKCSQNQKAKCLFKRRTTYQSTLGNGVSMWPFTHKKRSTSLTRIELELSTLKALQCLESVKNNDELSEKLTLLYTELNNLCSALKARKSARKTRALLKHKLSQFNIADFERDFVCPWVKKEIMEKRKEELEHTKRMILVPDFKQSLNVDLVTMTEKSTVKQEMKHETAYNVQLQRESFKRVMKMKQRLQSNLFKTEAEVQSADIKIHNLQNEIAKLLSEIQTFNVNLEGNSFPNT